METKILIEKIIAAKSLMDVFPDLSVYKDRFKELAKLAHPDKCDDANAPAAFDKIMQYKSFIEDGIKFTDDAGAAAYFPDRIEFYGDVSLLKLSLANYLKLIKLHSAWDNKMKIYLPKSGEMKGDTLVFTLWEYGVPAFTLGILPHDHVNWITNRMFAFVDWLCSVGFCHNGITPYSMVVLPDNHGLVCSSFYHLKPVNSKLDTVSGSFMSFYPSAIFKKKLSVPQTDVELVKKTAIWLLGDKSGIGVRLRKTHKAEIIDFLTRADADPYAAIDYHKALIKKLFEKRFVKLEV